VTKHHCSGDLTSFTKYEFTYDICVCKCTAWDFSIYFSNPLRYLPLDMNLKAKQIYGWWDSVSSISVLASVETCI